MEKLVRAIFLISLTVSVVLIVAGFCVPPTGVIDPTVLTAVGELFAFAALGEFPMVIRYGKSAKISKGNTTVTVEGRKPEDVEQTGE